MKIIRHFGVALVVMVLFVVITILGFVSGGAGWIALSFLCLWPLLWAATAWAVKGFREAYQLVPKAKRHRPVGESLS